MNTALFHSDVYVPGNCQEIVHWLQKHFIDYHFSRHMQEHFNDIDRSHNYKEIAIEKTIDTINENVVDAFEIELTKFGTKWIVTKYCIRKTYDDNTDVAMAIIPHYNKNDNTYDLSSNKIVTAWLNDRNDNHYTLDFNKYMSKDEWLKNR